MTSNPYASPNRAGRGQQQVTLSSGGAVSFLGSRLPKRGRDVAQDTFALFDRCWPAGWGVNAFPWAGHPAVAVLLQVHVCCRLHQLLIRARDQLQAR
jgi:hypothetical protein